MEKLADDLYLYNGKRYALAPGTYDPEDDASITAKIAENEDQATGRSVPLALLKNGRRMEVNNQASRLIDSVLPKTDREFLMGRFMEILDKKVDGIATPEERTELDQIMESWTWVKQVRAEADRLEELIDRASSEATLNSIAPNWPAR